MPVQLPILCHSSVSPIFQPFWVRIRAEVNNKEFFDELYTIQRGVETFQAESFTHVLVNFMKRAAFDRLRNSLRFLIRTLPDLATPAVWTERVFFMTLHLF